MNAAPQYVQARILLGVTFLSQGSQEEAIAAWNAVLAIEPENKSAKMYLRMAEAQRKKHENTPASLPPSEGSSSSS